MTKTAIRLKNKSFVVTGGSSGIGLAIATELAHRGAHVSLIARNADRLRNARAQIESSSPLGSVACYVADVGRRDQVNDALMKIGTRNGIYGLINNAGINLHGSFEELDVERLKEVMSINYWGAIYCIKASLPFIRKEEGHIGFVSSIMGFLGGFGYSAYAPTKFAMSGLAECLRMEVADSGVSVSIVYPPDTDTNMYREEQVQALPEARAIGASTALLSPEYVAQRYLDEIQSGKFEVYCTREGRFVRFLKGVAPAGFFAHLDKLVRRDRQRRARM